MSLSEQQCWQLGLASIGKNCLIHETVQFFNPQNVWIGENVRIDCFSMLSAGQGGIHIGNHTHIAAGCYLFGGGGQILLEDCISLSPRVSLFTASDDFKEGYLIGPCVPMAYRKVTTGSIILRTGSGVGSGSVVTPGVTIGVNARVGALTVVTRDVSDHALVAGSPAREIMRRSSTLYEELKDRFREEYDSR